MDTLEKLVMKMNINGNLIKFLELTGLRENFLDNNINKNCNKEGIIYVFGSSKIKNRTLIEIAMEYGINKDKIIIKDYYEIKNFNYKDKLANKDKVRAILIGPTPHKVKNMGNCNSMLADLKNNPDKYPQVIKLGTANELKITATNFREALEKVLHIHHVNIDVA